MSEQTIDTQDSTEVTAEAIEAAAEATVEATEAEPQEVQTFDAEYVKALRAEAAEYRVKAKRADALARQALTAMVTADGRLIDPSDLDYTDDLTTKDGTLDGQAITAAIDALIQSKPHLARKRPTAPIAQGARPSKSEPNLLQIIQAGA